MKKIFKQIMEKSLPLIENYENDLLVHDKKTIKGLKKTIPFLHYTNKNGTHLVIFHLYEDYPKDGESIRYIFGHADRDHLLNQVKEIISFFRRKKQELILYYNGNGKLSEVTQSRAEELGKEYDHIMRDKFRKVIYETDIKQ